MTTVKNESGNLYGKKLHPWSMDERGHRKLGILGVLCCEGGVGEKQA